MRRNLFFLLGGLLIALVLTLNACRKNESASSAYRENYKPEVVPEEVARKIAQRFPYDYFTRNKPVANANSGKTSEDFPITERQVDTC